MRRLLVIVAAGLLAGSPAAADNARQARLAEILEADAPTGVLDVEFVGCLMTATITRPAACASPEESWRDNRKMTDLRIIASGPPRVGIERDGTSPLIYDVIWPQSAILRRQARLYAQIREQGYDRFPDDVDARLRWFAERHRQETNPALFIFASETTRFCNGVALTAPTHDAGVILDVPTGRRDEFVALFAEELGADCDLASVPQG